MGFWNFKTCRHGASQMSQMSSEIIYVSVWQPWYIPTFPASHSSYIHPPSELRGDIYRQMHKITLEMQTGGSQRLCVIQNLWTQMRAYFLQIEIYSFILEREPEYWWSAGELLQRGPGNKAGKDPEASSCCGNTRPSCEILEPATWTDGRRARADFAQMMCS